MASSSSGAWLGAEPEVLEERTFVDFRNKEVNLEDPTVPPWVLSKSILYHPPEPDEPIGKEPILLNPGQHVSAQLAERLEIAKYHGDLALEPKAASLKSTTSNNHWPLQLRVTWSQPLLEVQEAPPASETTSSASSSPRISWASCSAGERNERGLFDGEDDDYDWWCSSKTQKESDPWDNWNRTCALRAEAWRQDQNSWWQKWSSPASSNGSWSWQDEDWWAEDWWRSSSRSPTPSWGQAGSREESPIREIVFSDVPPPEIARRLASGEEDFFRPRFKFEQGPARARQGTAKKRNWGHPEGKIITELQEGQPVEGVITNVNRDGIFIDIGAQKDGLLLYQNGPKSMLNSKVGNYVPGLRIDKLDFHRNRISLVMRPFPYRNFSKNAGSGRNRSPAPQRSSWGAQAARDNSAWRSYGDYGRSSDRAVGGRNTAQRNWADGGTGGTRGGWE